jgi:hypothetical protein
MKADRYREVGRGLLVFLPAYQHQLTIPGHSSRLAEGRIAVSGRMIANPKVTNLREEAYPKNAITRWLTTNAAA